MTRECHVRFCEGLGGRLPGSTYHFGMKAHIGVDAESGLVHSVVGTGANVSDASLTYALLHGGEPDVLADAGYQGVEERDENRATKVTWHVAIKCGERKTLPAGRLGRLLEKLERCKASIYAKVEYPFHVIKILFRHRKTHYRGLAKNEVRLFPPFGLANLVLARRHLLAPNARGAS